MNQNNEINNPNNYTEQQMIAMVMQTLSETNKLLFKIEKSTSHIWNVLLALIIISIILGGCTFLQTLGRI